MRLLHHRWRRLCPADYEETVRNGRGYEPGGPESLPLPGHGILDVIAWRAYEFMCVLLEEGYDDGDALEAALDEHGSLPLNPMDDWMR